MAYGRIQNQKARDRENFTPIVREYDIPVTIGVLTM